MDCRVLTSLSLCRLEALRIRLGANGVIVAYFKLVQQGIVLKV
jgi:hypothetical protein